MGAPGNVQARGLNPAQPSDQKYAAGSVKVPYCMCQLDLNVWKRLALAIAAPWQCACRTQQATENFREIAPDYIIHVQLKYTRLAKRIAHGKRGDRPRSLSLS